MPNRTEAAKATRTPFHETDDTQILLRMVSRFRKTLKLDAVMLTLDKQGLLLSEGRKKPVLSPTQARSVYDVTGAGDMVLAMAAAALANGADWQTITQLANTAAGLEVEKFGIVPIELDEILIELLKERFGHRLRLDRRIEVLRDFIDEHFQQPLSQARLAAVASLSPRQMNEVFRAELGMTPQQYLVEKRMQHAWQLLATGKLQVQQIAELSGYGSLASFSDRFRRHFGVSPRHFRRINE